jgi:hypothetical protein
VVVEVVVVVVVVEVVVVAEVGTVVVVGAELAEVAAADWSGCEAGPSGPVGSPFEAASGGNAALVHGVPTRENPETKRNTAPKMATRKVLRRNIDRSSSGTLSHGIREQVRIYSSAAPLFFGRSPPTLSRLVIRRFLSDAP